VLTGLPAYRLPGDPAKELVLNVVLYGMVLALLASMLWLLVLLVKEGRAGRD
jgi:hypothetical protein